MDIKYGIFYNSQFDVLMVNFNTIKNVTETVKNENLAILKNDDEIVGINIFSVSKDIELIDGLQSENFEVVNYVENKIESIIDVKQMVQFKIGKVISCENIESTHLHKTIVMIEEETSIVCGAKNIALGQYVVVATVGTYMPNGLKIIAGKLRGYDSCGMICSAKELGIKPGTFNDDGIIELPKEYHDKVGESFWKEYYKYNA